MQWNATLQKKLPLWNECTIQTKDRTGQIRAGKGPGRGPGRLHDPGPGPGPGRCPWRASAVGDLPPEPTTGSKKKRVVKYSAIKNIKFRLAMIKIYKKEKLQTKHFWGKRQLCHKKKIVHINHDLNL